MSRYGAEKHSRGSEKPLKKEPRWTPEEGEIQESYEPVRLGIRSLRSRRDQGFFHPINLPTRCEVIKEVQVSEQKGIPYVPEVWSQSGQGVQSSYKVLSDTFVRGSPGASSGHELASALPRRLSKESEESESESLRPPPLLRDPDDRWFGPSSQHKVVQRDSISSRVHDEGRQCCVSGTKGKFPCDTCVVIWTQELMSEVEPVVQQSELLKTPPRSYSMEELYEEVDTPISSVPSSSQSSVSPVARCGTPRFNNSGSRPRK